MNNIVWIIQGVLALIFLSSGLMKLTQSRRRLAAGPMPYMEDLTDGAARTIGRIEILAAFGLIVPAALGIVPIVSAFAAAGIVLLMIGAARVHIRRRETSALPINIALGLLALFVAIERFGPQSL
jgi:uncharacterized membrane protein YphA (DoxX/SURF4 family)